MVTFGFGGVVQGRNIAQQLRKPDSSTWKVCSCDLMVYAAPRLFVAEKYNCASNASWSMTPNSAIQTPRQILASFCDADTPIILENVR
jgi:hypothetical protein